MTRLTRYWDCRRDDKASRELASPLHATNQQLRPIVVCVSTPLSVCVPQVVDELQKFETQPGVRPFANVKQQHVRIITYNTKLFDISFVPGKLETDTEVLFIRVPGAGKAKFDNDHLEAAGDQLIVAFR